MKFSFNSPLNFEVLSVRSIRPKGLMLRQAAAIRTYPLDTLFHWVPDGPEAKSLDGFGVPGILFINLGGRQGAIAVDFELTVRRNDNRRSELPVRVRTNILDLP